MSILSASEIAFQYDLELVLHGTSLTASAGERIGISGRNGSGKSTLLLCLAGLLPLAKGSILTKGIVGLVSDEVFLYPHLTVEENLTRIQTMRKVAPARLSYLIQFFALSSFLKKPLHALSKGTLTKVLFVRALLAQPSILLLDEFSSALDSEGLPEVLDFLAHEMRDGVIVATTHDELRLQKFFTRRLILASGKLQECQ